MAFEIVFIITSVMQTYTYFLLYQCFFKEYQVSKWIMGVLYGMMFLCITVPYLIGNNIPMVNLIFAYIGFVIPTLGYQGSVKKKLLVATISTCVMGIAEFVVAIIIGCFNIQFLMENEHSSIYATICLPIVQFMVVHIIRNFKNMGEGDEISTLYWIICSFLPISSIVLTLIIYKNQKELNIEFVSSIFILFLINILVLYLYDRQMKSYQIEREREVLLLQNRNQEMQLNMMSASVENARRMKHDFLKHISMLAYLNEKKNSEEIDEYLKDMAENVEIKNKYIDTGNFIFDSIINFKMQEMKNLNIDVTAKVAIPDDLKVSFYDMNTLFSNLLDNSKEAVLLCEERTVQLEVMYDKERLKIHVKNPYKYVKKNNKNEYVTTKRNKSDHGLGLKSVKEVVRKYDGAIEIDDSNEIFYVFICLFL